MTWLDDLETQHDDRTEPTAVDYRLDALEQRIANLEQFLEEVANDMLDRTSGVTVATDEEINL